MVLLSSARLSSSSSSSQVGSAYHPNHHPCRFDFKLLSPVTHTRNQLKTNCQWERVTIGTENAVKWHNWNGCSSIYRLIVAVFIQCSSVRRNECNWTSYSIDDWNDFTHATHQSTCTHMHNHQFIIKYYFIWMAHPQRCDLSQQFSIYFQSTTHSLDHIQHNRIHMAEHIRSFTE